MVTEDYVSFETAKLLKEKGFSEATTGLYDCGNGRMSFMVDINWNDKNDCPFISAPTLQMVMKWLRKLHGLHVYVFVGIDESYDADGVMIDGVMVNKWNFWTYRITTINGEIVYDAYDQFDVVEHQTYEEAVESAILFCLNNLI